jgi:flagellar biosynthesis repressor protein FlbT
MPLKLTLRRHEKILIGNAVLQNGEAKSEFVVLNHVPVLREKDMMSEAEADTVAKKIYFTILNMYVSPEQERSFHKFYFLLLKQLMVMPLGDEGLDLMMETSEHIIAGDHYKALKSCRKLIEFEAEVLSHGE